MRFQAGERVLVVDSERVLVVLEQQLRRRVGGDVEREGSRIVLSGLGPSPKAINPRDRTVIEVRVQDGATLIDADVSFQASALAAPVGQEEIVRSKLQRVLHATRQQLEEEQDWLETERRERLEDGQASSSGVSHISSSSARIYTGPRGTGPRGPFESAESSGQHAVHRVPAERTKEQVPAAAANAVAASKAAAGVPAEKVSEGSAAAEAVVEVKDKALPEVKSSAAAAGEADNAAMGQQPKSAREAVSSAQTQAHKDMDRDEVSRLGASAPGKKEPNRPWVRWAAIAACLMAIVPFAWRMLPKAEPAPVIDLTQAVAKKPAPVAESGPEGALRQWELALRSTDANAQTAYYAVPVEQYMWKHNVNRHDLQAMKQQEIARRHGLWTVKVEDVAIQRKDGQADVTLVKHIMEQPQNGGKVRERLIHTQMTLKNSLGIWWITSEREIYQKKAATDDEDNFDPNEGETPSWAKPASVASGTTPTAPSTN